MSVYTALLDANVLYPAPLRDIFIQLALTDIYHAKWSATIHDEWMRSLLRDKPSLDRKATLALRRHSRRAPTRRSSRPRSRCPIRTTVTSWRPLSPAVAT